MKRKRKIPEFKSEDAEQDFWSVNDSTDYIDWHKSKPVIMPDLKTTTQSISIRLPEIVLHKIKMLANKRDVPYQSLIKIYLQERIEQELQK